MADEKTEQPKTLSDEKSNDKSCEQCVNSSSCVALCAMTWKTGEPCARFETEVDFARRARELNRRSANEVWRLSEEKHEMLQKLNAACDRAGKAEAARAMAEEDLAAVRRELTEARRRLEEVGYLNQTTSEDIEDRIEVRLQGLKSELRTVREACAAWRSRAGELEAALGALRARSFGARLRRLFRIRS